MKKVVAGGPDERGARGGCHSLRRPIAPPALGWCTRDAAPFALDAVEADHCAPSRPITPRAIRTSTGIAQHVLVLLLPVWD
jgi:hypothetical protein